MDQEIRIKLRNVVTQCRRLLEEAITQELEGKYSIFAKKDQVTADPNVEMKNLTTQQDRDARKDILDHLEHIKARGFKPKDALDQLIREVAFTHLNRLCAYKMMEAREVYVGGQKFREAVSRGVNSNGMKFYLAEHEEDERLFNTGQQDVAYRHFLDWLGSELSEEIGVLFNPNDSANRLYPRQKTLEEVLDLLNNGGSKADDTQLREQWQLIWAQDETIGWVYQYFTPKEIRDKARKESHAPRNSYELAFRNQFFTPRYVVEFLTDNTLGRIWYEMRKGQTKLAKEGDPAQCRYLVRRPAEIFLKQDEEPPKYAINGKDELSKEELLNLPCHIPHRPKKDPRELKILDPASGSGHFLLYCFDLLLTIYEEAYTDPDLGPALKKDYPTLDGLRQDVPRLILAHNLHGIDIDLRASQIAALALWLRCQRAYQDMGLKKDRPRITRSNFVCAEPMPGEGKLRKEFVSQVEPKVLGQVVEVVFEKMKLAGEAGSLLKIEEEIRGAVSEAKGQYVRETKLATDKKGRLMLFTEAQLDRLSDNPLQPPLFDLSGVTDEQFFEQAESTVLETLRSYAEKAQDGQRLQKRLFADDAVRGFAFIDLCQKRYDVVLMNPPFGEPVRATSEYLGEHFSNSKHDMFAAFCDRSLGLLTPQGLLGEISSRVGFFLKSFSEWRQDLISTRSLQLMADLGAGVLDTAAVEACCYVVANTGTSPETIVFRLLVESDKASRLAKAVSHLDDSSVFAITRSHVRHLPLRPFIYWIPQATLRKLSQFLPLEPTGAVVRQGLGTGDNPQFIRAFWEVTPQKIAGFGCKTPDDVRQQLNRDQSWAFHVRSGSSQPWYSPLTLVIEWARQGEKLKNHWRAKGETPSRYIPSEDLYFRPGLSWTLRHFRLIPYIVPAGCIPSASRYMAFPNQGRESDVLSLSASVVATAFMRFYGEKFEWPKHLVDTFKRLPFKELDTQLSSLLNARVTQEVRARRNFYRNREPFLDFTLPSLVKSWGNDESTGWNWYTLFGQEIEEKIASVFGLNQEELRRLAQDMEEAVQMRLKPVELNDDVPDATEDEDEGESSLSFDLSEKGMAGDLVSWCIGVLVGRWDIRYALNESLAPDLPDVFSPSIVFSLGSLLGASGVPATNATDISSNDIQQLTVNSYPIDVNWNGVLPDDPEHSNDVVHNIRHALEIVWPANFLEREQVICEALEVKDLRDYFRRSGKGGFWSEHVSRYSMSRRKAPIYWLLQSSRKSYALWLYYHRLDKDLMFKALVNYVEPKIRLENSRLESLRSQKTAAGEGSKEAKRLAKDIEKQEDVLSELRDFEDKLRRAANLNLEPDLNDGVVLNIAPLWELVPWKEAKKYWNELMEGKYGWSSIGKQLRQKGLVK